MGMFTLVTKLEATKRFAERTNMRGRISVADRMDLLLQMIADRATKEEIHNKLIDMRAWDFSGDFKSAGWLDNRLFHLVEYTAEEQTYPTHRELVDQLTGC